MGAPTGTGTARPRAWGLRLETKGLCGRDKGQDLKYACFCSCSCSTFFPLLRKAALSLRARRGPKQCRPPPAPLRALTTLAEEVTGSPGLATFRGREQVSPSCPTSCPSSSGSRRAWEGFCKAVRKGGHEERGFLKAYIGKEEY